jgi:hypothetical protein
LKRLNAIAIKQMEILTKDVGIIQLEQKEQANRQNSEDALEEQ